MTTTRLLSTSKGQIIIVVAVALVALLALVGLAIDVGMAYGVKARLYAAADAAALAAGRSISKGTAAAEAKATDYFNGNYPGGFLGSSTTTPTTNAVYNSDGSCDVTVSATASMPTTFARILGRDRFTVNATATTHVRTLDMVLVLDTSGSLSDENSPPGTFGMLKNAAASFIDRFDPLKDRIGLIHFASGVVVDNPICNSRNNACNDRGFDQSSINNHIGNLDVIGATTAEDALRQAKEQLDSVPVGHRATLRAIVFFTDGAPNGVSARFNNQGTLITGNLYSETKATWANTFDSCSSRVMAVRMFETDAQYQNKGAYCGIATLPTLDRSGTVPLRSYNDIRPFDYSNTRCNVNAAARNMLENVANAARSETGRDAIVIYTIGLGSALTQLEITDCSYGSKERGDNILKRLANVPGVDTYNSAQLPGMFVLATDKTQLEYAFQAVANQVIRLSR